MNDTAIGSIIAGVVAIVLLAAVVGIIGGCMATYPKYKVYQQTQAGKAELQKAQFSKQIAVQEAQAELDSADLKRQADIIRANGVAEANEIIAKSLTPAYIQWRWVEGLHDGSSEVIYIPTEANLPILEAARGFP